MRLAFQFVILAVGLLAIAQRCVAGVPYPPLSTCTLAVTQSPIRTRCIENFEPDVVRLCPAGTSEAPRFDVVNISVVVRDAAGVRCAEVTVSAAERSGSVNIAEGGATSAVTDAAGRASIVVRAASGFGLVGVCADGVVLREFEVQSPDAAGGPSAALCPPPTLQPSFVTFADYANPICGFQTHYGSVTTGINNAWDLNCDGAVNGFDLFGSAGAGGLLQHFGHGAALGARNTCP
ncbi:MAG: hypothetical protein ACKVU1_17725 [bacterium]